MGLQLLFLCIYSLPLPFPFQELNSRKDPYTHSHPKKAPDKPLWGSSRRTASNINLVSYLGGPSKADPTPCLLYPFYYTFPQRCDLELIRDTPLLTVFSPGLTRSFLMEWTA